MDLYNQKNTVKITSDAENDGIYLKSDRGWGSSVNGLPVFLM